MTNVLFCAPGRSFSAHTLPRKLAQQIQCWQSIGFSVTGLYGGDYWFRKSPLRSGKRPVNPATNAGKTGFRLLINNTLSEISDVLHDLVFALLSVARISRCEVLWVRSSRLHVCQLLIAKILRKRAVLEWKDNLTNYGISAIGWLVRKVEIIKENLADAIVVESEVLAQNLSAKHPKKRIIVAWNGVEAKEFAPEEGAHSRSEHIVISYIGSYAFYHNVPLLIEAMKRVAQAVPGLTLMLVGSGDGEREVALLIERSRLADRCALDIRTRVPSADVPRLLWNTSIAVLPGAIDEIAPIKIAEYMAAGCCTVAPDTPAIREQIEHQTNGLLFTSGDADSLYDQIMSAVSNEQLRCKIGRAGRKFAQDRLSWEATWGAALTVAVSDSAYP